MEQAFVKDPDKTIQDLHSDLVAKCGENTPFADLPVLSWEKRVKHL